MKRTAVTYGRLDAVLRSLGFTCRASKLDPPGRVYEHPRAGAVVMLPNYPDSDRVYEHHLVTVRGELENFGLADPSVFEAELQKTG